VEVLMKVYAEEVFSCTAEEYWESFFDEDYRKAQQLAVGTVGYRVLRKDVRGDEVVQLAEITEKVDAPGPVRKIFGETTTVEEEAVWKQGSDVARVKYTPGKMADRLRMSGQLRTKPHGEGSCKVVMDYDVEFKMFGVGGMVEKLLAKDLPETHRKAAAYYRSHPYKKK